MPTLNPHIDIKAGLAEGIGTGLLLAVVVGSGIMGQTLSGGNLAVALLANALATGAGLFVLITIFGPISGAHFNPVVSAIAAFEGRLGLLQLAWVVLAQGIGAVCGVLLAHQMFGLSLLQTATHGRDGAGLLTAEVVATAGLILTIKGAGRHAPHQVAILVALYIVAAYWFTASTSFANPAVTIARSLTDTFAGIAPRSVLGFIAAQVLGAAIGFGLSRWLFVSDLTEKAALDV